MLLIILALSVTAVACLCILAVRYRRVRRERDTARQECQGLECAACEINRANYRLACELYGQQAVDAAIRKSEHGGKN